MSVEKYQKHKFRVLRNGSREAEQFAFYFGSYYRLRTTKLYILVLKQSNLWSARFLFRSPLGENCRLVVWEPSGFTPFYLSRQTKQTVWQLFISVNNFVSWFNLCLRFYDSGFKVGKTAPFLFKNYKILKLIKLKNNLLYSSMKNEN